MAKLSETNPSIRTKAQRKASIARAVISSSACEGIFVTREDLRLDEAPEFADLDSSVPPAREA